MAELDPRIIMSAQMPEPVDVTGAMKNAMSMKTMQTQQQDAQRKAQQQATLADLYRLATDSKGNVDQAKVLTGLAQAGMGDMIPDTQEKLVKNIDTMSQTKSRDVGTAKSEQEILYTGLKHIDSAIASLAARPDVSDQMVMGELGRLVNLGAFDAQAKQQGVTPDRYAFEMASTMPVGNPNALRQWLVQSGMRVADASKRLETMLPRYDEQDRGGTIDQGSIDQLTGQRTSNSTVTKTNTPGERLSAATQARGQNMSDARAREFNDIQRTAQRTQLTTGTDGQVILVDKGAGTWRPAVSEGGEVAMDSTSPAVKNRANYTRVQSIIPLARDLLKSGPTASGAGAQADKMLNFIGVDTKGANSAQSLEALSGWLVANVPRMEGPQSNFDVVNYQTMAGKIGDRTLPVQTRMDALKTVEQIMSRYADLGAPKNQPTSPVPSVVRKPAGAKPSLDDFWVK